MVMIKLELSKNAKHNLEYKNLTFTTVDISQFTIRTIENGERKFISGLSAAL